MCFAMPYSWWRFLHSAGLGIKTQWSTGNFPSERPSLMLLSPAIASGWQRGLTRDSGFYIPTLQVCSLTAGTESWTIGGIKSSSFCLEEVYDEAVPSFLLPKGGTGLPGGLTVPSQPLLSQVPLVWLLSAQTPTAPSFPGVWLLPKETARLQHFSFFLNARCRFWIW